MCLVLMSLMHYLFIIKYRPSPIFLLGLISLNNYPLTVRPKNIEKLKLTADISLLTESHVSLIMYLLGHFNI